MINQLKTAIYEASIILLFYASGGLFVLSFGWMLVSIFAHIAKCLS